MDTLATGTRSEGTLITGTAVVTLNAAASRVSTISATR